MTARRPAPGQPEIGYIEPGHIPAGYLTERPPSPWGSRLVHWAATAAVLAAVVCLVGWPWPTLYALGLLAGASILLAGIRLLLTERRAPAPGTAAPESVPVAPTRRHALAFNALSRVLSDTGEFVRLSVRDQATAAVLHALDSDPHASLRAPGSSASSSAARYLQQRGFTQAEAVWLLCQVIGETYREVAQDADDGAEGGTWGETVPEALHAFAAAYRRLADDTDPQHAKGA